MVGTSTRSYYIYLLICLSLFRSFSIEAYPTAPTSSSNNNKSSGEGSLLKIVETEVWDAPTNSWKATTGDRRWTTENGKVSKSPSEIQAPSGSDFDGDWKIVVSGNDSMGWEYRIQYPYPPKRQRIWLRSLKPYRLPPPPPPPRKTKQSSKTLSTQKQQTGRISKALSRMRDDYNFKGFSIRVYKSMISWESMGIGLGLPITMNFDLWDRNPGLPSISSNFGFYLPLTLVAGVSTSVHVEWLRWLVKTILYFLPRILIVLYYQFVLPSVWAFLQAALLPMGKRMPPLPSLPQLMVAKPQYNPEISERLGCSLSYRWSRRRGFEWRYNYWHSYLPTFTNLRQLVGMNTAATNSDWWQKHFGSLGLSSGYPLPLPPHFSCSACLGLSGLYFRNPTTTTADTTDRQNIPIEPSPILTAGKNSTHYESQATNNEIRFEEPRPQPSHPARIPLSNKMVS